MNHFMPNTFFINVLFNQQQFTWQNVLNSIDWTQGWSHTFGELDHEIIYTVILLTSTNSRKGCQLPAKVCA